ncbi:hypothetical protein RM96_17915 [Cupriavidus sp. IDO]|nr:hypothetical protein RM96_17915 [Cupriavidus sp. IDO]
MYHLTPEEVAIRRQEEALRADRACGGCLHRSPFVDATGEPARQCKFKKREYGRRCELFERG